MTTDVVERRSQCPFERLHAALWYAMLTGTTLPDPTDAEPCRVLEVPVEPEPEAKVAEEDPVTTAQDNKRPVARPRFDLRAALAK